MEEAGATGAARTARAADAARATGILNDGEGSDARQGRDATLRAVPDPAPTAAAAPPARSPRAPEPLFRRRRTVVAEDCDELGHVNNAVWVRFVVELAEAHSLALGLDLAAYRELGGLWIVRRHEIDYHRPAVPGDEVLEETWVADLHGARSLRGARFARASDGALLVSAATHWAFVDAASGRPRRVPPRLRDAFPTLAAPPTAPGGPAGR